MRLTLLGTGSPEPSTRRASSGYLLEVAGERILFDCGGGVFDNLLRAGHRPEDVGTIVFSHLHSDHMMDYARLVHAAWDATGHQYRVLGPSPIAGITRRLFGPDGAFAFDLAARTELKPSQDVWLARGGTLPRPWPSPEITEIAPGDGLSGEGWRLSSIEVPHAQPWLTCLAFRVETDTASFVYSGDAGLTPALERFCHGADLLLHWCYRMTGEAAPAGMADLTPTPPEIAAMAARARAGRLLLTHLRPQHDTSEIHDAAIADMQSGFTGPSGIAEDLDVIVIG